MYPCPGCPHDRRILVRDARGHPVAAIQNPVTTMRTTGQCILHSAMLKGELEVVAWLLYNHPNSWRSRTTGTRPDLCLKALSALLRHHKKPSDKTVEARESRILLSHQVQQFRVPELDAFGSRRHRRTFVR